MDFLIQSNNIPVQLTMGKSQSPPLYIQEADLVLVCKKRYWNDLNPAHMDEEALSNYQAKDYHRVYIGEITQVLVRQKQIP